MNIEMKSCNAIFRLHRQQKIKQKTTDYIAVPLTDVCTMLCVNLFTIFIFLRTHTILVHDYQGRPEAFPEEVWRPVLPGYH